MTIYEKINLRPWKNWGLLDEIGNSNDKEDEFVISYFKNKKNGVVVDIGACDGITGTNSFKLINEYKWSGLLVECNPHAVNFLKFLYAENSDIAIEDTAVSLDSEDKQLFLSNYPGIHTISEDYKLHGMHKDTYSDSSIKVKCDTLNNIIYKHLQNKKIDFLSIDIEGLDLEILKNFNFCANKPTIISVEWPDGTKDRVYTHNLLNNNSINNKNLIQHMEQNGYNLQLSTYSNALFVKDWK